MISVLIPIYKPKYAYLDALFEVLSRQTISNFEIIISDDDNCVFIKDIRQKYPNLTIDYYKNTAKGIFNNLNNAIKKSKGTFLQILCQDDLVEEDFLQQQVNLLKKYDSAGLVFGRALGMDSEIQKIHADSSWRYKQYWNEFIPSQKAINYFFAYNCFIGNLSPCMLKRGVLDKVGFFSNAYPYIGDLEYWMRIINNFDICYNKTVPVFIRGHEEQASKTLGWKYKIIGQSELRKKLFARNNIKKSNFYLKCYINQNMGISILHSGIKIFLHNGSIRNFIELRKAPFSIFLTVALYVLTLNNKFPLYTLSEKDL